MKSELDGITSVWFGDKGCTKILQDLWRDRNELTPYVKIDILQNDSLDGHSEIAWLKLSILT